MRSITATMSSLNLKLDPFHLTKEQRDILALLRSKARVLTTEITSMYPYGLGINSPYRPIKELRAKGYGIENVKLENGYNAYTLTVDIPKPKNIVEQLRYEHRNDIGQVEMGI